ncbi:MAG: multifunctional transcriptional regulator/nicotinamide-nucleotide adenylyltransferase/ribosylnicotinamide kinase NadR [Bacilli bacterium]|nr:multifunctional transcriptional regulator/nicotinamide-nucleotide adenylyltransferase/ribosylnicotinamide kinase NadR [Bacilli bacterium]
MYEIGMYGGTFNPLHLGHVNDIIMAKNQCKKLYIPISISDDPKEIDEKTRIAWLKNITQDMENVEVFPIYSKNLNKETYDWNQGVQDVKNYIGRKIDVVFAGSDYKGENLWENLYKESKIIYFDREEINISSTEIRQNPYKYFDYLPACVRKYYTKKVCIIGTESCGKTTLVRNLAKAYNTTHVEEAGRYICDEAGGIDNMQKYHYFEILFQHKQDEKIALEHANKVLFIDTDSLITLYYYKLGFKEQSEKDFETIATSISNLNNYDLYLFLEPDVAWVQDGTRTYGKDEVRKENNKILKQILKENHIKYETITGNYEERYEKAKEYVNKLLKGE